MNIALALVIPFLSFAAGNQMPVEVIKLPDGKIAHCTSDSHLGTVGLYPSLPTITEENYELSVAFQVFGAECARGEEGVAWKPRPINAPFFTRALDGSPVENIILSSEAVITDRNYLKLLDSQALVNRTGQGVSLRFGIADLLSISEQDALRRGKPVAVWVNYFNRAINEYVYHGKRRKGRAMISGAYAFKFRLEQKNGKIEASQIAIR